MSVKKKYTVSNQFVEVYKYLNAGNMINQINELSELERYMLVVLSLDNHDIKDVVVKENLYPYREIGQLLYDAMDDQESDNEIIKKLIEITDDKYIDLSVLIDSTGNEMPNIADQSEIREWRLKLLY
jgi:hypothetical protein